MKKVILLLVFCYAGISHAQNAKQTLDEIVNTHVKEFRKTVGNDATVFIAFEYDASIISLHEKDLVIQPSLDSKKISSENNFLIRFLFSKRNGYMILKAVNFRIKKKNKNKLELINMGNGRDYSL